MASKNVFEYLEVAFKQVFSREGQYKLRSSYMVAGTSLLITSLLWILILWNGYIFFQSQFTLFSNLFYILGIFLSILIISCFEYSFYAIVLPKKLQEKSTDASGDFLLNTGVEMDMINWRKHLHLYFTYITIYSLLIIFAPMILIVLGIGLFYSLDSIIVPYVILATGFYIYAVYRLSIVWYGILFSSTGSFVYGWNILKGRVWETFRNFLIFGWIVGLAANIPFYVTQLFFPDLSQDLISTMSTVEKNLESLKTISTISDFPFLFKGLDFPLEKVITFIPWILLGFLVIKVGGVLKIAMIHAFSTEYFFEKEREYTSQ